MSSRGRLGLDSFRPSFLLPGTPSRNHWGQVSRGISWLGQFLSRYWVLMTLPVLRKTLVKSARCLSAGLCLTIGSGLSTTGVRGAWEGDRRGDVPASSRHVKGRSHQQDLPLLVLTPLVRPRSHLSVFSTVKQPSLLPSPNCPFWKEVTTRSPQLRRGRLHANRWRAERLRKMLGILPDRFLCPHWRDFQRKRTQVEGCLSLPSGDGPAPQEGCGRGAPFPGCRDRETSTLCRLGTGQVSQALSGSIAVLQNQNNSREGKQL